MTGLLVLSLLFHVYLIHIVSQETKTHPENVTIAVQIISPSTGEAKHEKQISNEADKNFIKEKVPSVKNNSKTLIKKVSVKENTEVTKEAINWYQVKQQLRSKINANFYYPRIAKHNGWQGKVTLSFIINNDGKITHHKILHSSGYRILDEAALKTISKVNHINISKKSMDYNSVNIELPIYFKINEG
ncbi:MAG: energy transducer TonB [Gammaproteobacteria bacterium]|nr:energy transducer TonB [Gammaproteobacteria bacterium]